MISTLFPVTIEYLSSMRFGLGPSNNLSIEIPHHSADVAVFSHVLVIVSGYVRPDNFNSATYITHGYFITEHYLRHTRVFHHGALLTSHTSISSRSITYVTHEYFITEHYLRHARVFHHGA